MSVSSADALQRAYERCRAITRTRARNFHYGIRLSREPQRSAIYALYAWMRMADDLVDAHDAAAASLLADRIDAFRRCTDAALSGNPPASSHDDPAWLALADTVQRFSLSRVHFMDMLDGQLADARSETYESFAQLHRYCRQVASTVGLLCLEIWGSDDSRAAQCAADRGVAFQLTNILRDVAEDHDAGRTYLPHEDFERFDITPLELRQWSKPVACRQLIICTVERARAFYEQSAPLEELVGASGRPTLWAMTMIYRRLLHKIARDPRRVILGPRVRVSSLHKGAIAIRARFLTHWQSRSTQAKTEARFSA